ncbi:MAG: hypothetical protein HFJ91_00625 [Muribaculaceae bacterium]|nr:hypothetical protein [Muribaculaceae bacterium]
MNDNKLTYGRLVSATVEITNTTDEYRKYDISAEAGMTESKVDTINNGRVVKDGVEVAAFSAWGSVETLNIIYYPAATDRIELHSAVEDFIKGAVSLASSRSPFETNI